MSAIVYLLVGVILAFYYKEWAKKYDVPKSSPFTTVFTVVLWPITAVFMLITTSINEGDE